MSACGRIGSMLLARARRRALSYMSIQGIQGIQGHTEHGGPYRRAGSNET